jgi:hypothetical protein
VHQAVVPVQLIIIPQLVVVLVKQDIHSWLVIVPVLLIVQTISSESTGVTHAIFVITAALPVIMLVLMGV